MNSNVINQNQLRQVFFIILILLMGIVLFMELASFLPALLGGITLYILLHRWMFFLTEKKKWRKGWTAILLMFFSFIVILMPVGLLVNMLSSKVSYAVQHSDELVTALKTVVNNIETRFNVSVASDENNHYFLYVLHSLFHVSEWKIYGEYPLRTCAIRR